MRCKYRAGNTRGLTDEQGNLVQEYFYDVYGMCWNVKKDPVNSRRYVGGYGVSADTDDGLLHLRAVPGPGDRDVCVEGPDRTKGRRR